jgi:hypothetical protein
MISRKITTALAAVAVLGVTFAAAPASAVVYCKTVGIPKGCVARPAATPAVVAPVAKTAVVATPRVGVAGGVGGPASGVGVLPGAGAGAAGVGVLPGAGAGAAGGPGVGAANQNGGVNRAGRR